MFSPKRYFCIHISWSRSKTTASLKRSGVYNMTQTMEAKRYQAEGESMFLGASEEGTIPNKRSCYYLKTSLNKMTKYATRTKDIHNRNKVWRKGFGLATLRQPRMILIGRPFIEADRMAFVLLHFCLLLSLGNVQFLHLEIDIAIWPHLGCCSSTPPSTHIGHHRLKLHL